MSIDHVRIFDTTLRDGEQAPGAAMTISEKVRIAHQLARLKVDIIEAGFPISSPAQFEAVQRVAGEVKGPVICALARTVPADIESAGQALRTGTQGRIHTFIATSDIHLRAKFGDARYGTTLAEKRETILQMATEAVTLARSIVSDVEFSAEDAGRTDLEYLLDVISAAVEAGATTINIPDTTGYCLPSEYANLFTTVKERCNLGPNVILSTHCHDDLGLAVANSLAGVLAGARQIECTINGIGERAGNASLEEVVMALNVRSSNFGAETGIATHLLTPTSRMVSIATGFTVPPNKAIVGGNAFSHEAGIHQHGVLKSRETYEIMRAEDVGQQVEAIRLGRHSGRHGLFNRLRSLGIEVAEEDQAEIYDRFVALADKKKEIVDTDLRELIKHSKGQASQEHFRLDQLRVATGTGHEPRAEVLIHLNALDELRREIADGDGPVDAIYKAIDQAIGSHHDLVSYSMKSVGEGADAMGEVTVLVEHSGTLFRGVSRNTDVLRASAESYIKALNRLETFLTDETNAEFVGDGIMQPIGDNP